MAKIDMLFKTMLEAGESDLHLVAGQKPVLRVHGELERLESHSLLANDDLRGILDEIASSDKKKMTLRRRAMWILVMNFQAWHASEPISSSRNTGTSQNGGKDRLALSASCRQV